GGAQEVQMLTGVIVIQDTDGLRKIQARQLPHPNGSVSQEDHDLGLGHTAANGFGAEEGTELVSRNDGRQVSGRGIIPFGPLVRLVRFTVREDSTDLDLAGAGSAAILAFAPPDIAPTHGRTGSVGAYTQNVSGHGVEHRRLSRSPAIHGWSYLPDQALDLARIDL